MVRRKTITSNYNQYEGINPLLQSKLQQLHGGWSMFHDQHINAIAEALNRQLPDNYYATTEDSLQIATRSEPDSLILKDNPTGPLPPDRPVLVETTPEAASLIYLGVLEIPLERFQKAAVLYKRGEDEDIPVTRLELLSPSNIEPGREALAYDTKRAETLSAGINLIELHYLNETPPPQALRPYVPLYLPPPHHEREPGATAYYIAATTPRDKQQSAQKPDTYEIPLNVAVYPFGIEDPLPTIRVPLADEAPPLLLNMQNVYDTHFFNMRWGHRVDYGQPPHNLHLYSDQDRFLIDARTLTIRDAVLSGHRLDNSDKLPIPFDRLNDIARSLGHELPDQGPKIP
jgi:hypothetical protein